LILLCKILIVSLSFMGKLVNQESTLCNKTLQRVPFATYFGITPYFHVCEHSLQAGRSAELSRLPNCSATYFAVQSKSVLYIAKIVNLAQRWAAYYRWEEVRITQKTLKKIPAKIATHCSMSDILAVR